MSSKLVTTTCFICNQEFDCNPVLVPTVQDRDSIWRPKCRACADYINYERERFGHRPFDILSGAYEED